MSVLNVILKMRADGDYQPILDIAMDCGLQLKAIKYAHIDFPYVRKSIPPKRSIHNYIANIFMLADNLEQKEWFEYCVQLEEKRRAKIEEDRAYLEKCITAGNKVQIEISAPKEEQKLEVKQESWLP